jgi:ElaA protein
MNALDWRLARFADLTPQQLHDVYRLRAEVFVVEQTCPFQDIDGVDPQSWHLRGFSPSPLGEGRGESPLLCYCRLIPAGIKYAEPSIGRIVTAPSVRGTGLGRVLMRESLERAQQLWPAQPIRIGAQARLERFYNEFGFVKASDPYDEDGILHIEMVRPPQDQQQRDTRKEQWQSS